MFIRILKPLLLAGLLAGGVVMAAPESAAPSTGEPAPKDMSTAPYNDPNIPPEIIAMAPVFPKLRRRAICWSISKVAKNWRVLTPECA
ncbi:hypothetical protein [Thiothrix subterranea]|uniref:hypothetical protein n=1 Tax=Thiothrix subterranea TaxID=2735563 RepID=UPI00280A9E9B|nr:hypothetical protein [Thiothrix subterranea]